MSTPRTLPRTCNSPATFRMYHADQYYRGIFLCHACKVELWQLREIFSLPRVVVTEVASAVGAVCERIVPMELEARDEDG